jgi:Arc/MetJ family transcription regulator
MAKTTIDLDDDLLDQARAVLGTRTVEETVNGALGEIVARPTQAQLIVAEIERGHSGFYRRLLDDGVAAVLER